MKEFIRLDNIFTQDSTTYVRLKDIKKLVHYEYRENATKNALSTSIVLDEGTVSVTLEQYIEIASYLLDDADFTDLKQWLFCKGYAKESPIGEYLDD